MFDKILKRGGVWMIIYKIYNKNTFNMCNSHKNKNSDEKLLTRNYFCGTILIVERRQHKNDWFRVHIRSV